MEDQFFVFKVPNDIYEQIINNPNSSLENSHVRLNINNQKKEVEEIQMDLRLDQKTLKLKSKIQKDSKNNQFILKEDRKRNQFQVIACYNKKGKL